MRNHEAAGGFKLTVFLDCRHQLLVLIHVLHINMLLLSSLGTYTGGVNTAGIPFPPIWVALLKRAASLALASKTSWSIFP